MTLEEFKKRRKKLPDTPGVYFFLDARKKILYIGKATSLHDRVRSYFASDLVQTRGEHMVQMVERTRSIDYRQTDSVLEALILEASLIRSHKPDYNTQEKDDKSFNHIVITKENFPRVMLVRGKELAVLPYKTRAVFGPFPHGSQLKEALKIIRKIFPFRDNKCIPCEEQQAKWEARPHKAGEEPKTCRACFNRHVGLCPGVCTGEITKKEYARRIRQITLFFNGKKKTLLHELERDMNLAAKEERFEDAADLRHKVFALQHIQDVSLIKDEFRHPGFSLSPAHEMRIEAYDAAHFGGEAAIGVMTVVEGGEAEPSEYRLFTLRNTKPGDDVGALTEILSRRLLHSEWRMPRLIVVDGSTAQINAAKRVLKESGVEVPVVSVVKDEHHRPRGIHGESDIAREHEQEILLANAEAHRFAISHHRRVSRKAHRAL